MGLGKLSANSFCGAVWVVSASGMLCWRQKLWQSPGAPGDSSAWRIIAFSLCQAEQLPLGCSCFLGWPWANSGGDPGAELTGSSLGSSSLHDLPWNLDFPQQKHYGLEVPATPPWLTGPAGATLIHFLFHKRDLGAGKDSGT